LKAATAPDELEWDELPTFDELVTRTGMSRPKLRAMLTKVPCWRCTDNSVRYSEPEATEALSGAAVDDSEHEPEAKIDLLYLFNKMLGIMAAREKDTRELIKVMGEPLRSGIELWKESSTLQSTRLGDLEKNWDRMVKLVEEGLTAQNDRDIAAQRFKAQQQMRVDAFALVKDQVPSIVQKWGLTSQASTAITFIQSLDPGLIDMVLELGQLTDEQQAMLKQLRASMPARPVPAPSSAPTEPPQEQSANGGAEQHVD
jgi:hypothetical protein